MYCFAKKLTQYVQYLHFFIALLSQSPIFLSGKTAPRVISTLLYLRFKRHGFNGIIVYFGVDCKGVRQKIRCPDRQRVEFIRLRLSQALLQLRAGSHARNQLRIQAGLLYAVHLCMCPAVPYRSGTVQAAVPRWNK